MRELIADSADEKFCWRMLWTTLVLRPISQRPPTVAGEPRKRGCLELDGDGQKPEFQAKNDQNRLESHDFRRNFFAQDSFLPDAASQ